MRKKSKTIWYAFIVFILGLNPRTDLDSLNYWLLEKKSCFGSFFLNAVNYVYIYFSTFNNPTDNVAYGLGFSKARLKIFNNLQKH